jgi:predicted helicase
VLVLDPACGTGTFLYAVVDLIREQFMKQGNAGKWPPYVRENLLKRLFGFELLMAPYAVAHLKLGMQLAGQDLPEAQRSEWGCDLAGHDRLGVYLTNTLEEALKKSELLMGGWISDEANAAAEIKRDLPIMVVLGNPPYSGISSNKGAWIDGLLRGRLPDGTSVSGYYEVDGKPLGEKKLWLQDDYVKFIRFGQWRIQQTGAGILAFITNHAYLDNPTFRGMRQSLSETFTEIYVLNLHGSTRKREQAPGAGEDVNVFDIQQGVAIGVFVKEPGKNGPAQVHHTDLWGRRDDKYAWLLNHDISTGQWDVLMPQPPSYLFEPQHMDLSSEYERCWNLTSAMPTMTSGIITARDHLVIDFEDEALRLRMNVFRDLQRVSDSEAQQRLQLSENYSWRVADARRQFANVENWQQYIVDVLYRPFDIRRLVNHPSVTWRPRESVMRHMLHDHNVALIATRQTRDDWAVFVTCTVAAHKAVAGYDINSVFPLYMYPLSQAQPNVQTGMIDLSPWPEGKGGRRPNLEPKFVEDMAERIGLSFVSDGRGDLRKAFGPEDVFHYIYAVLHSPTYRSRYAEFLKTDFPRVPLTSNLDLFRTLVEKGSELVALHLLESPTLAKPITRYPVAGPNIVDPGFPRCVAPGEPSPEDSKPVEAGRVYINKGDPKAGVRGQYFEGVPREVWEFWVGG